MSNIHSGHRERLKNRFEREGLDSFAAHEVLELLLFNCIPRADTNPIAHNLLERFGSLPAVLEASKEELIKVPGVGGKSADFLTLIPSVARRYITDKNAVGLVLDNVEKLGEYLKPKFIGVNNEQLYVLCLDKKYKLLSCTMICEGSIGKVSVDIRLIVETVVRSSASLVVLAHNHTHGFALPSNDDIRVTSKISETLRAISVEVIDHIIVAQNDFVSFSQSGLFVK